MIETIFSGLLGGALRFAPEVLKFFDRKNERGHELAMLSAEMDFARLRGEQEMHRTEAAMTVSEIDAVSAAIREQGETARAAGWFVAALSALVRPVVTYWMFALYNAVKAVGMYMAIDAGAPWQEVLLKSWTDDDMSMLTMILTFWFVGRIYERQRK